MSKPKFEIDQKVYYQKMPNSNKYNSGIITCVTKAYACSPYIYKIDDSEDLVSENRIGKSVKQLKKKLIKNLSEVHAEQMDIITDIVCGDPKAKKRSQSDVLEEMFE